MSKVILVTGATGNQGGALIDALLSSPSPAQQFTVLGVTRDPSSPSAQSLSKKYPALKVIQGNFDDVPALFRSAREVTSQPVWGVFSVQAAMGKGYSPTNEEQQGKSLIDESMRQGVRHFVQTSVDRGGDAKSWDNPTNVPHFASKHNIELHLRDQTAAMQNQRMAWTILRPVAFMDNWSPGFQTKVFFAALREKLGSKPLQLIAAEDIGKAAAQVFLNSESTEYKNQAIGLAGDELNFEQINEAFRKKTGHPAPATFGFLGNALVWGVKELGLMMSWFATDGYGVDIQKTRRMVPSLMTYETWLETRSKFVTKA